MRARSASVLLCLLLAVAATPAAGATRHHRRCAAASAPGLPAWARHRRMTVINDSVLLSGEAALRHGMPCWHIRLLGRPALMLRAAESELRRRNRRVAPLVVIGLGYNSLWERHRARHDYWAHRFDGEARRLLATLRRLGGRQFVWVTLRHADRSNTTPHNWGELGLYSWYFPYVNERLRILQAQQRRLVLADWSRVGDRRGVTYDSIHLNDRGGRLMAGLVERTIYREAHRQEARARAAQDPCSVVAHRAPRRRRGQPRPPLVVGDSTNLLAVDPLVHLGVEADARGCRQVGPAVDILAARRRAGTLPRVAVLAVGANGSIPSSELARALRIAGPRRVLGLVTTPVPASSAQAMRAFHARHPTRTILIDWGGSGIPQRYGGDGLHIGYAGEAQLARFIFQRIRPYVPPRRRIVLSAAPGVARPCGTITVRGHRLAVYVERGQVGCGRARGVARSRRPEALRTYQWFNWRFLGRAPWTDVFVRRDGRVIVAARRPPPAPAPGTGPPAPSDG